MLPRANGCRHWFDVAPRHLCGRDQDALVAGTSGGSAAASRRRPAAPTMSSPAKEIIIFARVASAASDCVLFIPAIFGRRTSSDSSEAKAANELNVVTTGRAGTWRRLIALPGVCVHPQSSGTSAPFSIIILVPGCPPLPSGCHGCMYWRFEGNGNPPAPLILDRLGIQNPP